MGGGEGLTKRQERSFWDYDKVLYFSGGIGDISAYVCQTQQTEQK